MRSYKVLSALMAYPTAEAQAALVEMSQVLTEEQLFTGDIAERLRRFMQDYQKTDIIERQEAYVALFDRGRHLSLHLFEHVHGESRARGQAMVELMDLYAEAGFDIDSHELPDFLPLYLEFLSLLTPESAKQQLSESLPVIALIGERLASKDSDYRVLFEALEQVAGAGSWRDSIRKLVASEAPDMTLSNMDEIWEEEAVSFMGADKRSGLSPEARNAVSPSL